MPEVSAPQKPKSEFIARTGFKSPLGALALGAVTLALPAGSIALAGTAGLLGAGLAAYMNYKNSNARTYNSAYMDHKYNLKDKYETDIPQYALSIQEREELLTRTFQDLLKERKSQSEGQEPFSLDKNPELAHRVNFLMQQQAPSIKPEFFYLSDDLSASVLPQRPFSTRHFLSDALKTMKTPAAALVGSAVFLLSVPILAGGTALLGVPLAAIGLGVMASSTKLSFVKAKMTKAASNNAHVDRLSQYNHANASFKNAQEIEKNIEEILKTSASPVPPFDAKSETQAKTKTETVDAGTQKEDPKEYPKEDAITSSIPKTSDVQQKVQAPTEDPRKTVTGFGSPSSPEDALTKPASERPSVIEMPPTPAPITGPGVVSNAQKKAENRPRDMSSKVVSENGNKSSSDALAWAGEKM